MGKFGYYILNLLVHSNLCICLSNVVLLLNACI